MTLAPQALVLCEPAPVDGLLDRFAPRCKVPTLLVGSSAHASESAGFTLALRQTLARHGTPCELLDAAMCSNSDNEYIVAASRRSRPTWTPDGGGHTPHRDDRVGRDERGRLPRSRRRELRGASGPEEGRCSV